ncbi:MAG TPA: SRPBCC family protein [Acidimicrobiales bacterium]|jgi:hypothetical protein|nr:SRPBCC family protein [Acidimicrobiales bacterium]
MKIENEFSVSVPIGRAWDVLTDLEKVAPCLPGATLTGRDGDDYLGKVTVKLGPVTSEFSGKAHFVEKDEAAHRAVIQGKGREVRGGGNAQVAIIAQLSEGDGRTIVTVDADLRIAGKIAQFGSSLIQQVSIALLGEFAARLEQELTASDPPSASPLETPVHSVSPSTGVDALRVLDYTDGAVVRRILPVALGVIVLVVLALIVLR